VQRRLLESRRSAAQEEVCGAISKPGTAQKKGVVVPIPSAQGRTAGAGKIKISG
jgi:hypothetical protein